MLPRSLFCSLITVIMLLTPVFVNGGETAFKIPASPPEAGVGGWVSLFDGESLDGWRGFRMDTAPETWVVEGGELAGSGKGGNLASRESYADFELYLEWKIGPGGNSGIILRASEETKQPWHSGPEMQVIDNVGYPEELRATQMAGSLYDLVAAPEGLQAPADVWNRVFIRVVGTRYTLTLNGMVTADLDLDGETGRALIAASKFKKYPQFGHVLNGPFVLQAHGDPVAYRNILIRRL